MGKKALTDQIIAALAEGATTTLAETAPDAETVDTGATTITVESPPAADKSGGVVSESPPVTAAATAQAGTELLAYLQTELSAQQGKVTDLTVQLNAAKAKLEANDNLLASLRGVTSASVERLRIALNFTAVDTSAMSTEALLAEHAALRPQFEKKYPAGGVAAVSSTGSDKKAESRVDPMLQARINANRIAK